MVSSAVEEVITDARAVTYDLGGRASTSQMTDAIIDRLS